MEKETMTNYVDGVFRFTNCSDEDFAPLWNNVEYRFPKKSTCPIIIPNETSENIQEIRKRFAYKYAQREYFRSKSFNKIRNGDGLSVLSTFDANALQPYIDQCLEPLPVALATATKRKGEDDSNYKSKAVGKADNVNEVFKDQEVVELGEMPA